MKKITLMTVLCCLSLIFTTLVCSSGYAQTLSSGASTYAPGTTATLTGTGFTPNENVVLQVLRDDAAPVSGPEHDSWTVMADNNGDFTATWTVCADDCVNSMLVASAYTSLANAHAAPVTTNFSNNLPDGNGVFTLTPVGGSCIDSHDGNGGSPDNWEVAPGGTYDFTLTGVTECSGTSIKVFFQNSGSANFCVVATGGNGTYSGTFTVPSNNCATTPISYKCDASADCDNLQTYNAKGPFGSNIVHLRANTWGPGCTSPTEIACNPCIAPLISGCNGGGDLGCNPTLPPAEVQPTFVGTNAAATYTDGAPVSTGSCGWSITRTWTVTGTCGSATCDQVYTYSVATAPVFENLPVGGFLGCNPAILPSCTSVPGNLVVNGDFSSGNSSFLSQYTYVSDPQNQTGLWPDGVYTVAPDANVYHSLFFGQGHSGNFMIVNGSVNPGLLVWQQTIDVTPNTDYYFATWVSNVDGQPVSSLNFSINGTQIGSTFNAPVSNYVWSQFYQTWNSGSNTSAVIAIVNQNTVYGGNDFGLDDITFSVQSPVASASNECGDVPVTCSAGPVNSNGCERTQSITYTATATCGGTTEATVDYSWTVPSEVAVSPDGPLAVCEDDCPELTATAGFVTYQWYLDGVLIDGEDGATIHACASGVYSVSVTNDCGCTSTSNNVSVNVNDRPACSLEPISNANLPVANTDNNQLCADADGGNNNTYLWTLTSSDNSWYIMGSATGSCVTYHCGTFGSTATFTFTPTAHYGALSCSGETCQLSFQPEAHEQCSYTQGFYGQVNGQTSCTGMPAPTAIGQALQTTNLGVYVPGSCNPIVLGNPATNKKMTIGCTEVACVTTKLPAGGPAAALANGPWTCTNYTNLQNGKFKNILLGQTLTLAINARLFPGLLGYHLTTPSFTTYASADCDPSTDDILPGSQITFNIPQVVINCLGNNQSSNKVSNLLAMANKVLGGIACGCVTGAATPQPADFTAAVAAVNEGFDKCRIISGYNIRETELTTGSSEFNFTYQPNPTNGITKATFVAPVDGNATMEVYSVNGNLVSKLYNESVTAGNSYIVEFNASEYPDGVYFIRTTVGGNSAFGKLVIVK